MSATASEITEEAMTLTNQAQDLIEETLDKIESVEKAFKNNPYLIAGVALVALTAGAAAGYWWANKKLKLKYELIADQEIAEAREYQRILHKDGYPSPAEAVEALIPGSDPIATAGREALRNYQGHTIENMKVSENADGVTIDVTVERDEPIRSRNIFDTPQPDDDEWDYDIERAKRTSNRPFIIHHDEFVENDDAYETIALTYFKGDDVLSDESDGIVENVDKTVGHGNLQQFGHGSGDPNVVYVRNDKSQLLFEIVKHEGKYSVVALGEEEG